MYKLHKERWNMIAEKIKQNELSLLQKRERET